VPTVNIFVVYPISSALEASFLARIAKLTRLKSGRSVRYAHVKWGFFVRVQVPLAF